MDYELTIFDRLLQFTLFQGMSQADLHEVVGHTKLGFSKMEAGKRFIQEGDNCTHLFFLTAGTLQCKTSSDDHSYSVTEYLKAPYCIQPEHLFGINQRYTSTFHTLTDCNFISIEKQEVLLLLETQLVFRLNMLSMLATDAQRMRRRFWRQAPQSLRSSLTRFFFSRCLHPAGPKTFHILMNQLAAEMNDSRIDISHALHEMQQDGLLTLHRGRIEIPLLERLLM